MFRLKKIGSIVGIALMLSLFVGLPNAFAAEMSDIEGHWAEKTIETWVAKEWIHGYPDETFRPDDQITRAEITVLINNAFDFSKVATPKFSDVEQDFWYYDQLGAAVEAGYIAGYPDGTFKGNNLMTRQEFAIILDALLDLPKGDVSKLPADAKEAPDWSRDAIADVYEAGLITGYADDTFRPRAETTRAEVVIMLQRALPLIDQEAPVVDELTEGLIDEAGTYGGTAAEKRVVSGDLEIAAEGVTLENVIVKGNLLLAASIGEGDVTLKNVTVEGKTTIAGGGEDSIYIEDSKLKTVVVNKENGKVRVVVKGSTTIESLQFHNGGKLEAADFDGTVKEIVLSKELPEDATVELIGDFDTVTVEASDVTLNISQGSVKKLTIAKDADNVTVILGEDVHVELLIVNAPAKITGEGTVDRAEVNADDVEIDVEVDELVREDDEDGTRPGDSRPPAGGGGGGSYPGGGGGGVGTDLASVNGLSVNVTDSVYNESVYNADRRGGKFTFVIPEDINEDDVIKSFEITGSSNAKTLNIGGYSVEFDKGVASATVNEILGDLAPSADGITVKELIQHLVAKNSPVFEVEGTVVSEADRSASYKFVIDASDYINQLPTLTDVSVKVGDDTHQAEKVADNAFKFVLAKDVDEADLIQEFEVKGAKGAASISVDGFQPTASFDDGVAKVTVSEFFENGITVEQVKEQFSEGASYTVTVSDGKGHSQSYTIELEIE